MFFPWKKFGICLWSKHIFKMLNYALSRGKRLTSLHLVNKKKLFIYTRAITQKRVTSGGVHFRAWQHSSEEMQERWRICSDTVSNLTGQGIEPKPLVPITTS